MIYATDVKLRNLGEQAYVDARTIHGDLSLTFDCFLIRLFSVVEKALRQPPVYESLRDLIDCLHTGDLYLSFACAEGGDAAWREFDLSYRKYMRDIAGLVLRSSHEEQDLAAAVLADMFLPGPSGQSLIAGFDGRTALATWLRVIITRRALNERERKWNQVERLDCLPDIEDEAALTKVERYVRENRYKHAITASIRFASLSLSERERLILLMRYEDSMQMNDIARFFDVHPSTVTRQLQQAYQKLKKEILGKLATDHYLSEEALEECLADLLENPSHSVLNAFWGD